MKDIAYVKETLQLFANVLCLYLKVEIYFGNKVFTLLVIPAIAKLESFEIQVVCIEIAVAIEFASFIFIKEV